MNRSPIYKTPAFIVSLVGSWLMIAGGVGVITGREALPPAGTNQPSNRPTTIKVVPARGLPASSIDQLQGTSGLQGQSASNLQRSSVADRLQPNAKTDTFTETDGVQ